MPGYRFRLGSFSSHSSRGSNQENQTGNKPNAVKYEIKLAVLGKTGTGKTAIIHRFLYDQFPEKHKETIDEVYINELELVKGADTRLTLDILDCGGSQEFPAMKRIGILNSNAFILVYSIDDADSFDEVRRLRELILDIKLEKHIAKYSGGSDNSNNTNKTNQNENIKQQSIKTNNNDSPMQFVKKETTNSSIIKNPVRQDLKLGQQRRHSLNNHLNGAQHYNRINGTNQLCSPLNGRLTNQLINNRNNQQQQNNHSKRHHHHHHHHKNTAENNQNMHKKPYIIPNINQRYKLSENLKLMSERRKSLTNSTRISELKSISETPNLTDVTHQQHTADILCLRPSKLQTTSLPIYEIEKNNNHQQNEKKQANDDIQEDEENAIRSNANRGRRRSSFLLSPDSLSSESSSCESSDDECESTHCEEISCSSSSSCCSVDNLNLKLDQHKQDKENKTNNFEHINNLNNYKTKLEMLKEREQLLQREDLPPFEPPVIVVVGNKCDLENQRAVETELAENIVQIDWNNGFIECSAKNNYNMTAIFKEMLKQSKLPFVVSNALDSQKNRRRSLPAYPNNLLHHLKEPIFRTKRNSCALS